MRDACSEPVLLVDRERGRETRRGKDATPFIAVFLKIVPTLAKQGHDLPVGMLLRVTTEARGRGAFPNGSNFGSVGVAAQPFHRAAEQQWDAQV
jgi:hypothetical protein